MDLFDYVRQNTMKNESPLASRIRPETLDEVVGQQHIIGKDKLLYLSLIHITEHTRLGVVSYAVFSLK